MVKSKSKETAITLSSAKKIEFKKKLKQIKKMKATYYGKTDRCCIVPGMKKCCGKMMKWCRIAWGLQTHKFIPLKAHKLELSHQCGRSNCVNVKHLEVVTHKENVRRIKHHKAIRNRYGFNTGKKGKVLCQSSFFESRADFKRCKPPCFYQFGLKQ